MEELSEQKPAPTTAWLWQAFTGVGLIILLAIHMIAQHFVAEGGIRDFAGVVELLSNPIIVLLELLFLVTVTAHALLGVRAILFDLGLSAQAETIVSRVLLVAGILTVAYGMWLTWTITQQI
jgi:succinate dehydrogenase hydrophobic anchor subunit